MKYRSHLLTRLSCAILFILMIIRNRMMLTYATGEIIPAWLNYSDIAIFSAFTIILFYDWKKMRIFHHNPESEEAKKDYRKQTIINWIALVLFVIYIISRLMRVFSF